MSGSQSRGPRKGRLELDRQVGGREHAPRLAVVAKVRGAVPVRLGELAFVANDQGAGPEGQEEALVRVHDHASGALDARQKPPAVLGQDEEAAVGGVNLEPQVAGVHHVGDVGEGVDRARVRRAGGGDHEPRAQACGDVRLHRLRERIGAHPPAVVERDVADLAFGQARDAQRLVDAVVGLARQVDDASGHVGRADADGVASRDDSLEVRDARAGGQIAARRVGVADEPGHPPHERPLHERRGGSAGLDARVSVANVGEEIAERRRKEAPARDVRELPAGGLVDTRALDHADRRQRLGDRRRGLGDREEGRVERLTRHVGGALSALGDSAENVPTHRSPELVTLLRPRIELPCGGLQVADRLTQRIGACALLGHR